VDLAERTKELAGELGKAADEAKEIRRRLEALDRQAAARADLAVTVSNQVSRASGSRSFRYGHRLFRGLSLLTLRRRKTRTALDMATEILGGLEAPPGAPLPASQSHTASAPVASTPSRTRPDAAAAEERRRRDFRARHEALHADYDGAGPSREMDLSVPLPRDRHGMLVATAAASEPGHPSVDVIVCVRDAPDDVRACLWSLLDTATRPFHLIVVDDGSGPETAALLDDVTRREPAIELLRNPGPDHGYTRAANIGMRAATGAYAVLLNSDTVVTPRWLERIVACGESDDRIGIVGPLSNAATHQSIPAVKDDGGWAVNELPRWLTVDALGELTAQLSSRDRPRVPFVNGFCFAVKRSLIDSVGLFDEERFGSGYCEENDLSVRAQDAGFELAIADDAYVFHSKSRSYTPDGRQEIARRNYQLFLDKHGADRVAALLEGMAQTARLDPIRSALAAATASEAATIDAFRAGHPDPLEILFVLHGMPDGSSGGGHSIYQEASAMQRLGIPARIAIRAPAMDRARAAYPDADRVFAPYSGEEELARHARTTDVVVATHFTTVGLVARLRERYDGFLVAYYVQDYEPFFVEPGSPQLAEASDSYTAIPGQVVFAKTHWLCNLVGRLHGADVAKVEPSIDSALFSSAGHRENDDGPVRVAAMIRPRTPRRQPVMTLDLLSDLADARGGEVHVTTFGCPPESIPALGRKPPGEHLGLLTREQVADLLKRTDVFVDASTYQAFGRTAIEAMACGATAIVPRIGGAGQFVRHMENGLLVDTLRPETVSAALTQLVDDSTLRRELQRAAVKEARGYSTLRAALSEYAVFERELT
jgi:GT2 family glycosyltransferase/glycosyltransferase involved in cell wall biosynthesis